ncbi:hypothetical protein V8E36_003980 [Tilletia maclaganii]
MLLSLLLGSRAKRRRQQRERGAETVLGRTQLLFFVCIVLGSGFTLLGLARSFTSLSNGLQLSQQCRMSRMWPAYAAHSVPSALGSKYSLFLYRERGPHGHPHDDRPTGTPALFIPGNAGHYGQVRSVASSCATQYYEGDGASRIRPEWIHAPGSVDWWTVHFNEDFSAFHSQTLIDQATFVNEVIAYLLDLYAHTSAHNVTSVPLLGHSMGGIVARLMLDQPNYVKNSVDTIITLSTPHVFPPAPFDRGIESIYTRLNKPARLFSALMADAGSDAVKQEAVRRSFPHFADVLLISVGSGTLDTQITSEASTLALGSPTFPPLWPAQQAISTFTAALPGLWSSVGHVSMAWCDQLRERIARASMLDALLFRGAESRSGFNATRQRKELWERLLGSNADWAQQDGSHHLRPPVPIPGLQNQAALPSESSQSFDVQAASDSDLTLELITDLAVGSDPTLGLGVNTHTELQVLLCETSNMTSCTAVSPTNFELVPPSPFHPTMSEATQYSPSILFPHAETRYELPGQGLRRWRASAEELHRAGYKHVKFSKLSNARSDGFCRAGWVSSKPVLVEMSAISAAAGLLPTYQLDIGSALQNSTGLPQAPVVHFLAPSMDSSLLAYRLRLGTGSCDSKGTPTAVAAFSPFLSAQHRGSGDAIWFPSLLEGDRPSQLAATPHQNRLTWSLYASSPYVPPASVAQQGTLFSLFFDSEALDTSSGLACGAQGLHAVTVEVDWLKSLGLLAMRYRFAALVFPLAILLVLAGMMWDDWNAANDLAKEPSEDGDSPLVSVETDTPAFPSLLVALADCGPRALLLLGIASVLLSLLQSSIIKLVGTQAAHDQGMLNWLLGYPGPASFSSIALGPTLLLAGFGILVFETVVLVGLVRGLASLIEFISRKTEKHNDLAADATDTVVGYSRNTILAMGSIVLAVFLAIPYQLAFLVLTLAQLINAVRARVGISTLAQRPQSRGTATRLRTNTGTQTTAASRYNQQMLILVLMMAVLPLKAPVLIVWARNVMLGVRAPATTPGLGDHNVLEIVAFVLFVQVGTAGQVLKRAPSRTLARITQMLFSIGAIKSLTWGLRYTYLLYDGLNILFAWLLFVQWRARRADSDSPASSTAYAPLRSHSDGGILASDLPSVTRTDHESIPDGSSSVSTKFDSGENVTLSAAASSSNNCIMRMNAPASVISPSLLPASLAASADLSGIRARNAASRHKRLDALLAEYLDLAATYHDLRIQSGPKFAQGHIDLVRAKMQVGGWNLAKLGNDGWDARLVAQTQVRPRSAQDDAARVESFEVFSPPPVPSASLAGDGEEDVQSYTIDEEPAVLRQRRRPKAAGEDETGGGKDSGKRAPLPPDPLYQFAALPPPPLRSAKGNFEQALQLCIGGQIGEDADGTRQSPGILAVMLRMARVSQDLESARLAMEQSDADS